MTDKFRYLLRVRYSECDAQKVVFNARYGEYVDVAVSEYFRALGYGEQMVSAELDFQLVKQTTEWRGPARYDQVLEISVFARHIGNTSFTLACEFRIAGAPQLIALSETVYVQVQPSEDGAALVKKAIAPLLRSALERGVDALTDHAGMRS